MTDIVQMVHKDLPLAKPANTTPVAFADVWKDKGWSLVKPEEAAAHSKAYADSLAAPEKAKPAPAKAGGAA